MFHAGIITGLALLALPFMVGWTILGQLVCRLFGEPTSGPVFSDPDCFGYILTFKAMANAYKLIPYLPIVGGIGFIVGI